MTVIKNYLWSSMAKDRLSNLSILSNEYDIAKTINVDDVIDEFASVKQENLRCKFAIVHVKC
jgi:hypothetical protein